MHCKVKSVQPVVMFKTRAAVFYRLRPNKACPASFLIGFKNIPGEACVQRIHNNDAFVNIGNKHTRKTLNTAYY